MSVETIVVYGVVRDGVVVPVEGASLPEGVRAAVVITPDGVPADLQAELAAWEAASDEAWSLIDEWEMAEAK